MDAQAGQRERPPPVPDLGSRAGAMWRRNGRRQVSMALSFINETVAGILAITLRRRHQSGGIS